LVAKHRKKYLQILSGLGAQCQLSDYVYILEFEDAVKHSADREKIAAAYKRLQRNLQHALLSLAHVGGDDELPYGELSKDSSAFAPRRRK
jgi:hypothetical protein